MEDPRTVNLRDRALVGGLVVALALVAVLVVAAPEVAPSPVSTAGPTTSPGASDGFAAPAPLATYHEGIVGRWASVTPATARTNADRELVALIFSGLVRLGGGGEVLPDLAESWTVDKTGSKYTFTIRPDAVWHDGVPVTSADVAFTFKTLQDPEYAGPMSTSWNEVKVVLLDDRRVRFELATPLGGFLTAMTQPLLPEHLLRDVAPADLATSGFARMPVGSGPFRLISLDSLTADLERVGVGEGGGASPSASAAGGSAEPSASAGAMPSGTGEPPSPAAPASASASALAPATASADASATPSTSTSPSAAPVAGRPIDAIQMHFYDDAASLSTAYRAGRLDSAVGLTPSQAGALAALPGSRLESYPTSTLTALLMNQRGQSVFRNASVRTALAMLVDRDALVKGVLLGQGMRADGLVPPGSWAFDPKATGKTPYDRTKAAALLKALGWRKLSSGWVASGRTKALQLSLIAPSRETNPITFATASRIAKGLNAFGLKVKLEGLTPAAFAQRLQAGTYSLAVGDMNLGLDPDLYPLLASTQATTSGSNISGVQSLVLDRLLSAARKPGSIAARRKAYAALEQFLAKVDIVVPVYYRNEPIVLSDAVSGPSVRQIAGAGDRFWDVLTWRLADGR
jgi:ABC-type transport system substrate-binding protein